MCCSDPLKPFVSPTGLTIRSLSEPSHVCVAQLAACSRRPEGSRGGSGPGRVRQDIHNVSGFPGAGHDTLSVALPLGHTLAADHAFLCTRGRVVWAEGQGTEALLLHFTIRCGLHRDRGSFGLWVDNMLSQRWGLAARLGMPQVRQWRERSVHAPTPQAFVRGTTYARALCLRSNHDCCH